MKEILKNIWGATKWYRILTKSALFSSGVLIVFSNSLSPFLGNILILSLIIWLISNLVIIRRLLKQISAERSAQLVNNDATQISTVVNQTGEANPKNTFTIHPDEEVEGKYLLNFGHIVTFLFGFYFLFLNINLFLNLKLNFLNKIHTSLFRLFGPDLTFMFWFILLIMVIPYIYLMRVFNKKINTEPLLNKISYENVYKWLIGVYLSFPITLVSLFVLIIGGTLGWGVFIVDEYFKQHPIIGAFCNAYFWFCLIGAYFALTLAYFQKCYSSITKPIAIFLMLSPIWLTLLSLPLHNILQKKLLIEKIEKNRIEEEYLQKRSSQ